MRLSGGIFRRYLYFIYMDYKEREYKLIYDIVDGFGGERKNLLISKIKFLLRNQRIRIIKEIEKNLDKI